MISQDAIGLIAARAISARAMTENVPSPCVALCRMDAQGYLCEGCLRSLDEIRLWSSASDAQKKVVWSQIEQRIAQLAPTGGSAAP